MSSFNPKRGCDAQFILLSPARQSEERRLLPLLRRGLYTVLMFFDCIMDASTSTYSRYKFWMSVPLRQEEVEILRRRLKMGLASLAFYHLEVIFFSPS